MDYAHTNVLQSQPTVGDLTPPLLFERLFIWGRACGRLLETSKASLGSFHVDKEAGLLGFHRSLPRGYLARSGGSSISEDQ